MRLCDLAGLHGCKLILKFKLNSLKIVLGLLALTTTVFGQTEWENASSGFDSDRTISSGTTLPDGNLLLGTTNREILYLSVDNGANWVPIETTGLEKVGGIRQLAAEGETIFLAGNNNSEDDMGPIYLSKDRGRSWTPISEGYDKEYSPKEFINLAGGDAFVIGLKGNTTNTLTHKMFKYESAESRWVEVSPAGLSIVGNVTSAINANGVLLLGGTLANNSHHGIFRSTDGGDSWEEIPDYLRTRTPTDFTRMPDGTLYLSTRISGTGGLIKEILKSNDDGLTWEFINFSGLDDLFSLVGITSNASVLVTFGVMAENFASGVIYRSTVFSSEPRSIALSGNMIFGEVEVDGETSIDLTIRNNGTAMMTVSDISFPEGYSGDWLSGSIASGMQQKVKVSFMPTESKTYSGDIIVTSDALEGKNTIGITGEGVVSPTRIIALGEDLIFGEVEKNSTTTLDFNITNNGNTVLAVSEISYPEGYSGNWPGGNVDPGASQMVTVSFNPTEIRAYSGDVSVISDATGGDNTLGVSGSATVVTALENGYINSNDLKIYPNPSTSGMLHIESLQMLKSIEVLNSTGNRSSYTKPNALKVDISLEGLSNGIYLVLVQTDAGAFRRKVLLKSN